MKKCYPETLLLDSKLAFNERAAWKPRKPSRRITRTTRREETLGLIEVETLGPGSFIYRDTLRVSRNLAACCIDLPLAFSTTNHVGRSKLEQPYGCESMFRG